jgi:hypothetical protein
LSFGSKKPPAASWNMLEKHNPTLNIVNYLNLLNLASHTGGIPRIKTQWSGINYPAAKTVLTFGAGVDDTNPFEATFTCSIGRLVSITAERTYLQ